MKIYFTGLDRESNSTAYAQILVALKAFGHVLGEHIGDTEDPQSQNTTSDSEKYGKDMALISQCDAFIAEVSAPAWEVGYEIAFAETQKKRVLCIYKPAGEKPTSSIILGNPNILVRPYQEIPEANKIIAEFLNGK